MRSFIVNIGIFIVGVAGGFLLSQPAQNTQNIQLESKLDQMSLNIKNIQVQLSGGSHLNKHLVKALPYEDMSMRELLAEIYNRGENDAK